MKQMICDLEHIPYYLFKTKIYKMKLLKEYITESSNFDSYRVICYSSNGSQCLNVVETTKTKAVEQAQKMKRDGFAFSYAVYGLYEKDGKRKRKLLKQG